MLNMYPKAPLCTFLEYGPLISHRNFTAKAQFFFSRPVATRNVP